MEHNDNASAGLWLGATLIALSIGIFVSGAAPRTTATSTAAVTTTTTSPPPPRFRVPVTSTQPSRGPSGALVTIVQWCGLRGAACRDADAALKTLMTEHPNEVRVVYRHLPDRRNIASQLLHHVAHGVHTQAGKFWEFRDMTLATDDDTELGLTELRAMVEQLQTDWTAIERGLGRMGYAQHVNADLTFAGRFGVDGELGLFVNGRRIQRAPEQSLLEALRVVVGEEFTLAQTFVARGVARTNLYDEITRDAQWTALQQWTSAQPSPAQPTQQTATR